MNGVDIEWRETHLGATTLVRPLRYRTIPTAAAAARTGLLAALVTQTISQWDETEGYTYGKDPSEGHP